MGKKKCIVVLEFRCNAEEANKVALKLGNLARSSDLFLHWQFGCINIRIVRLSNGWLSASKEQARIRLAVWQQRVRQLCAYLGIVK